MVKKVNTRDDAMEGCSTILDCILVLGSLGPFMPTNQEVKDFDDAIKLKIAEKVFTFSCSSYNFNLKNLKDGYEVRACCLKFGDDWFNNLNETIKKAQEANTPHWDEMGHINKLKKWQK